MEVKNLELSIKLEGCITERLLFFRRWWSEFPRSSSRLW